MFRAVPIRFPTMASVAYPTLRTTNEAVTDQMQKAAPGAIQSRYPAAFAIVWPSAPSRARTGPVKARSRKVQKSPKPTEAQKANEVTWRARCRSPAPSAALANAAAPMPSMFATAIMSTKQGLVRETAATSSGSPVRPTKNVSAML